ncbi:hypothetical protein KKF59_01480 [Patescibacteria group bacterium]|nr:hypothetical protein [Patescibacteria group bacterium]MBU1629521.1 hypothetical protein [Patescibacteria group bacterium]MBU1907784.1 hypothetical protein [Patescibacteria group bacterium]
MPRQEINKGELADTEKKSVGRAPLERAKDERTLLPDAVREFEIKRDSIKRLSRALENEIRLLGMDAQTIKMRLNKLQRPRSEQTLYSYMEKENFVPAEIEKLENFLLGNSLHREVLQEAVEALKNDSKPPADLDQVLGALEKRRAEKVSQLYNKGAQNISEEADYKAATNELKSLSDLREKLSEHFKL